MPSGFWDVTGRAVTSVAAFLRDECPPAPRSVGVTLSAAGGADSHLRASQWVEAVFKRLSDEGQTW